MFQPRSPTLGHEAKTDCDPYCFLVGANLLIEEAKVEFPNGMDGLKFYSV